MPRISLKKREDGNVEILEDGKRVATSAADSAEKLARSRGGEFVGFEETPSEDALGGGADDLSPGVGSSSSVRNEIKNRGEDPNKINFRSEDEFETFKDKVEPEGGLPKRGQTRVDQYEKLKDEAGIEGLEDKITDKEAQIDELDAELEAFAKKEAEGQSGTFAAKRVSEAERNINERKAAIQREINTLNERLNTKTKAIEITMKLTDADFQDARREYEFEYNKNLAVQSAFRQGQSADLSNAKATYNTLVNMFSNSNKSFDDLSPSQQQQISELEVKIGLPTGTFESLATTKPKANVIQTGTGNDAAGNQFAWMIVQGEDGNPEIVKTFTGGKKSDTSSSSSDTLSELEQFIRENKEGKTREQLIVAAKKKFPKANDSDIDDILNAEGIEKKEDQNIKLSATQMKSIAKKIADSKAVKKADDDEKLDIAQRLIQQNKSKQKWTDRQAELIAQAVADELELKNF